MRLYAASNATRVMTGLIGAFLVFAFAANGQSSGRQDASDSSTQISGREFALKLFKQVAQDSEKNVIISPFSAYSALCMTLNGATGSTLKQMAQVLGVRPDAIAALNTKNQSVLASLAHDGDDVRLDIANAIYADNSVPFKPQFIETCRHFYAAEIENVNFGEPDTVKKINTWCDHKTQGKIPSIIDSLKKREKMVLLNAIYFNGSWAHQFKENATRDDQFNLASGEKMPIKMMHSNQRLVHFTGSNFEAVVLPYAGNRQCMYIFLPERGVDLAALRGQFVSENWKKWMSESRSVAVNLSLPRFTIDYSAKLNDVLMAMGMSEAFAEGQAKFANLVGPRYMAWISRVLQKTYMDVNEKGTEAAAATAVVIGVRATAISIEPRPIEFRVDRPFVLALIDRDTGEILFLGSIVKPSRSGATAK
jgi:serine protease inhibitor